MLTIFSLSISNAWLTNVNAVLTAEETVEYTKISLAMLFDTKFLEEKKKLSAL